MSICLHARGLAQGLYISKHKAVKESLGDFSPFNHGLAVTEYVSAVVAPIFRRHVLLGAAQDNGVSMSNAFRAKSTSWRQLLAGDGTQVQVDSEGNSFCG